nr:hypothetical protein [Tanacetum cinerariifolium]
VARTAHVQIHRLVPRFTRGGEVEERERQTKLEADVPRLAQQRQAQAHLTCLTAA